VINLAVVKLIDEGAKIIIENSRPCENFIYWLKEMAPERRELTPGRWEINRDHFEVIKGICVAQYGADQVDAGLGGIFGF
jgi:hypothetical protein